MPSSRLACLLLAALAIHTSVPTLASAAGDPPALRTRLGRWLRREPGPNPVPPPPRPPAQAGRADTNVRQAQADGLPPALSSRSDMLLSAPPSLPSTPFPNAEAGAQPVVGSQSLSLQAALNGALAGNPDLVTLRQGNALANAPSPEAVEVARRFPTALNPTLWIDYRPITLIPNDPRRPGQDYYRGGQQFLYISLRQPLELGHQTTHRHAIAKAALAQQRWTVLQAELTALVQTYRFFQTAAYRREKLRVANELADFNDRLLEALQKGLEANQAAAADVVLARVESRAARQQVKAVRQDYLTALADLNNQVGAPESSGAMEPLGEFTLPATIPPLDEQAMLRTALESRPDIHAARAQIAGAEAAVRLARADRIPSPVVGPEYQTNENGSQFVGFVYITPIPILNGGNALVRQREAESRRARVALQQAQSRASSQVRAAVAKWNGATDLIGETGGLTTETGAEVANMERLFEEGQADLPRLMQAQQRLIQLENQRLDAVWAATQAQADLLLALGAPHLINSLLSRAEGDASVRAATPPPPAAGVPRDATDPAAGPR